MIDIEPVLGGDRTDPLQLLGGDLAGQQRDDVPGLALPCDPLLIVVLGHRRETHLLIVLVTSEQHILEHR